MIPSHIFMHTGQRDKIQAIENNCPGDRATPARAPMQGLGWVRVKVFQVRARGGMVDALASGASGR